MKPPMFNPPYDSPIEEEFARVAVKHLHPGIDFVPQYEVQTLCGRFILDFVAVLENRKIGFECDGADFHEPSRDEWRDAMILGDRRVDAIYRLRGSDIHRHLEDCLHLIARREPAIFSDRGRANLRTLTTPRFRDLEWNPDDDSLLLDWPPMEDDEQEGHRIDDLDIVVRDRRAIENPESRHFWVRAYEFAVMYGGGRLEEVREAWGRVRDKDRWF